MQYVICNMQQVFLEKLMYYAIVMLKYSVENLLREGKRPAIAYH